MAWLNCTPKDRDKRRADEYTEDSPYKELSFLPSYEQTLINYWIEAGQVSQTANGPVPLTWDEIDAWARRFYTEQYVEWVEQPRPLRSDGQPDERYKPRAIPLSATQCLLTDWELQTIRRLSAEYVSELSNTDPNAPCPKEIYIEELSEQQKLDNSKSMGDSLKAMFGVKKSTKTKE